MKKIYVKFYIEIDWVKMQHCMLKKWDNIYKINILKVKDKLKKDKNSKLNKFIKLFNNQNKE